MFIMRIVESFAYCILLDHMRSLEGLWMVQTILAREAVLCLGGGAGDLFIGSSTAGSGSGRG